MKDYLIACVYGMALIIIVKIVVLDISPESISIPRLCANILFLGIFFSIAVIVLLSDINDKLDKDK